MYCHQLRLSIDEIYMQLVAALRCFVLEKSTQLVSTLRRFILEKQNRLGIARPLIMTLIILASTTVLVARSAFILRRSAQVAITQKADRAQEL